MWFTSDSEESQAHSQVTGGHSAKLTHEHHAAAASYEAAKAYEKQVQNNGKPANHSKAVEHRAALTGGFVDRIAETKGMDALDKEKAKHAGLAIMRAANPVRCLNEWMPLCTNRTSLHTKHQGVRTQHCCSPHT
jgi:hypothetical protein